VSKGMTEVRRAFLLFLAGLNARERG